MFSKTKCLFQALKRRVGSSQSLFLCKNLTFFFFSFLPVKQDYNALSDIIQLDGPADNSDHEEDEEVPLQENDFLGLINAEVIKALQEENESSDSNSVASSSSSSGGIDELADVEEGVGDSALNAFGSYLQISCKMFANLLPPKLDY